MGATEAFDKLNPRQREAACAGAAPLLIVAGAGTGKTNTLAHRVAHLVLQGCPPERILLLTFTRRAALEMTRRASRIVAEVKKEVRLPWSGTFHAVANRLIRLNCKRLGLTESFSVLDRGDAADLMDVVRHERGLSRAEKRFPRKDTCLAIYSHRVNTQRPLAETLALMYPWCAEWEVELKNLLGEYVNRKLQNQALDYDDLLLYWHAMMQDEALAAEIGARFDHVLVDEYQDTNVLQAEILQRLKPTGQGLTVVGDDAQAIYSFRAATVENIRGFARQYENRGQSPISISLEENYRSTQQVLDAANALIGKSLYSKKKVGAKPRYVTVADDEGQAQYVVTRVLEARERGVLLRNQAVLFRASHHSDLLELELVRRNIPYVKYGGLKFLEAAHVKDLLAVLRWADNPKNRVAAFRALQLLPGVGPAGAARIFTGFEAGGSWKALKTGSAELDQLMSWLADSPWEGQVQRVREWYAPHLERLYDSAQVRAGDLLQLERIAQNYQERQTFLTEMALDPPSATGDLSGEPYLDEDYLVLSTVHSAKGQEWEAVHILNVADGNFPSEFATGRADLVEEERRLLYVAMTRARTDLHLIAPLKYYVASQSRMGDRHVYGAKSRFMTRSVLACMEPVAYGEVHENESIRAGNAQVDVAASLRKMWT
ncbi:MAG TPA: ATP-dependent helicase [Burkholderiales bacterium]|nr:ATP-dependent helicase [Burkholderiales bacterium]